MLEIDRPERLGPREWLRSVPFFLVHLACFGAFWTGVPAWALALCAALYFLRMFAVTAGYHRYFSHRTFKLGRVSQFALAFAAQTSGQRGVLWWASHHRHHHKHSDTPDDIHSVAEHGLFWAHFGWIYAPRWRATQDENVHDLRRYPELVWLDRHHNIPIVTLGVASYLLFGWAGLVVGFFWSTVLLWHGTFAINSLAHVIGTQRYDTGDDSRNSFWLALITLGEGWHNNHHYYQASVNQGFRWYEIDITYYLLVALSWTGLVRDLKTPPRHVVEGRPHPAVEAARARRALAESPG